VLFSSSFSFPFLQQQNLPNTIGGALGLQPPRAMIGCFASGTHAQPWATVNILLRQLKRIGDLILTTPAIDAGRDKFAEAQVTLAIASECRELAPAIPNVDRLLIVRRNWRTSRFSLPSPCGGSTFAWISPAMIARPFWHICLARRNGSPRMGHTLHRRRGPGFHRFHRKDVALLRPLGIEDVPTTLRLDLPSPARHEAQVLLRDAKIDNRFAIFHPGAARAEKFWEVERWAELVNRARPKIDIVLTGTRSDVGQEDIQQIKAKLREPVVNPSAPHGPAHLRGARRAGATVGHSRFRSDESGRRQPDAIGDSVWPNQSISLAAT
jgi:Glycosyltransferase family 9 (heptosyltransferase)